MSANIASYPRAAASSPTGNIQPVSLSAFSAT